MIGPAVPTAKPYICHLVPEAPQQMPSAHWGYHGPELTRPILLSFYMDVAPLFLVLCKVYFSVYYYTKCVLLKAGCALFAALNRKMCNITSKFVR